MGSGGEGIPVHTALEWLALELLQGRPLQGPGGPPGFVAVGVALFSFPASPVLAIVTSCRSLRQLDHFVEGQNFHHNSVQFKVVGMYISNI